MRSSIRTFVVFNVHISPSFVCIVIFVSVYSTWWSQFASRLEWRCRHGLGYISHHISVVFLPNYASVGNYARSL